jgi:hypothetical protein
VNAYKDVGDDEYDEDSEKQSIENIMNSVREEPLLGQNQNMPLHLVWLQNLNYKFNSVELNLIPQICQFQYLCLGATRKWKYSL